MQTILVSVRRIYYAIQQTNRFFLHFVNINIFVVAVAVAECVCVFLCSGE